MGLIFGYAILNKADKRVEAYNLTKPATGSRTACTIYPIMSSARSVSSVDEVTVVG